MVHHELLHDALAECYNETIIGTNQAGCVGFLVLVHEGEAPVD